MLRLPWSDEGKKLSTETEIHTVLQRVLVGFHLRDAAAGQEQAGTSRHRRVRWSTPTLSSFPFYWSFEG